VRIECTALANGERAVSGVVLVMEDSLVGAEQV
jgi:hypothetical protein